MSTGQTDEHTHGYTGNKEALLRRLRRVEGQVRGVARMVDEDRYCIEILTQLSAIQAAVDKVALGLMEEHVQHCVMGAPVEQRAEKADELVAAVGRLLRSR